MKSVDDVVERGNVEIVLKISVNCGFSDYRFGSHDLVSMYLQSSNKLK
jgi:hypothetical protein